jgi:putative SOS response-associated peptidase YedK
VCGRFTQQFSYSDLHAYFEFFGQPLGNLQPRYSICPTQDIIVATASPQGGPSLVEKAAEGTSINVQCQGRDRFGKTDLPRSLQGETLHHSSLRHI